MSQSPPSFHRTLAIKADLESADTAGVGRLHWVKLHLTPKRQIWEQRDPPPDQITIHFEQESFEKFHRLAEAINQIFGDQVQPQEKTSEL